MVFLVRKKFKNFVDYLLFMKERCWVMILLLSAAVLSIVISYVGLKQTYTWWIFGMVFIFLVMLILGIIIGLFYAKKESPKKGKRKKFF